MAIDKKSQSLIFLHQMWVVRIFEDTVHDLLTRGVIGGNAHLYAGEEAVAVGSIATLHDKDLITSTHRGHGHCFVHGDHFSLSPEEEQDHLNRMMAEICGRVTGYSQGRGGSMHIADVRRGNLGATGIVGGNIPVATGAALAARIQKTDQVVLCFFGDGATNNGVFHESLNLASLWDLPVVYICENNLYGMSVPFAKASKNPDVAHRACAYDIPGEIVDGMDVWAVNEVTSRAVDRARQGKGPSLIECKTYRWYGHARSDPGIYRTKEEVARWKTEKDPITLLSLSLMKDRLADEQELENIEQQARSAVEQSVTFALSSPEPSVSELLKDVFYVNGMNGNTSNVEHALSEKVKTSPEIRKIPYWKALNEALQEEMEHDQTVFVMGEDVGLYGSAFGVTRGLLEKFGSEKGQGHTHLGTHYCRCRGWECHGRHASCCRDHVRGFRTTGDGSNRESRCQEPLHVWR